MSPIRNEKVSRCKRVTINVVARRINNESSSPRLRALGWWLISRSYTNPIINYYPFDESSSSLYQLRIPLYCGVCPLFLRETRLRRTFTLNSVTFHTLDVSGSWLVYLCTRKVVNRAILIIRERLTVAVLKSNRFCIHHIALIRRLDVYPVFTALGSHRIRLGSTPAGLTPYQSQTITIELPYTNANKTLLMVAKLNIKLLSLNRFGPVAFSRAEKRQHFQFKQNVTLRKIISP